MNMAYKNIILAVLAVAVFALPLVLMPQANFEGTDNQGTRLIQELAPDYQPWFNSLWSPGGSVETLLFSLQAAIGSGIICYYLGYRRGRKKERANYRDHN